jgi:hypothetical protein
MARQMGHQAGAGRRHHRIGHSKASDLLPFVARLLTGLRRMARRRDMCAADLRIKDEQWIG